ncbi:MAG: hypothetical protein ACOH14_10995 [Rhodoglobus sp.]
MSDIHVNPYSFATGALLSVLAIPLAIIAALVVGQLGIGIATTAGAIGMFAGFPLFALGSRHPVTRGRDFTLALIIGAIATVLGALTGLITDAYTALIASGGTTGVIGNILAGQIDFPFPTRLEDIVVPLTITAVLAILAVAMNAAKALAAHRDNFIAKANAAATTASNRLATSRNALSSSASTSANAANKFASHVMSINTSSSGILLNGKPLEQQEDRKPLWHGVRDSIYKALRG